MQRYDCILKQILKSLGCEMNLSRLVETINGPDDSSVLIFDRFDMSCRPNARPVRSLDHTFDRVDGDAGVQHGPHRRLFMGNLLPPKPVSPTKSVYVVIGSGCAAPHGDGPGIEPDDSPLRVTSVD